MTYQISRKVQNLLESWLKPNVRKQSEGYEYGLVIFFRKGKNILGKKFGGGWKICNQKLGDGFMLFHHAILFNSSVPLEIPIIKRNAIIILSPTLPENFREWHS